MLLYELRGTVSFASTDPPLVAQVEIDGTALLIADVELIPGIAAQLNPIDGTVQAARLQADTIVSPSAVVLGESELSTISADDTLESRAGWSIDLPASSDNWQRGALGYELDHSAPPPGLAPVDVSVVYQVPDGTEVPYAFLSDGFAQSSSRKISRANGHTLAIEGMGAESRYDRKKVTLQLPPRHGLTHGQLIRGLLSLAGIPASKIGVDAGFGLPRMRALDVVKEESWPVVLEIAKARGAFVAPDQDGVFQVYDGSPNGRRWTFNQAQIVAERTDLEIKTSAEVTTCIVFNGSAPELPDDAEGVVSTVEVVEVIAPFSVPGAEFSQDGAGVLTVGDLIGPLPEKEQVVSRVTTIRRERQGCLLEEEVITEGWFAPEAARYTIAADGTLTARAQVFLYEAGAAAFDGTPAYLWDQHKFVTLSRVLTRYTYAEPNDPQFPDIVNIEGSAYVAATYGELIRKVEFTNGWFNPRAAIKERATPADAWETTDFVDGQLLTGGGDGVFFEQEEYHGGETVALNGATGVPLTQQALRVNTTELANKGGYLSKETATLEEFALPRGLRFQFQGEAVSDWDREIQVVNKTTLTTYSSRNSGGTAVVVTEFDRDGKLVKQERRDQQGSAPAAVHCSPEDAERKSGRPFSVRICAGVETHVENEDELSNEFVESEAEAEFFCIKELRRRQAPSVTLAVPVNAALHKGDPVFVYLPDAAIVRNGWIESHGLEKSTRGQSLLSEFEVKLHPF